MLGPPVIVPCALDHVREREFYTESDYVLFIESPDDPPMDPFRVILHWDEVEVHDYIMKFFWGIPKNYGCKTAKGNTMCKVRDFSLNVEGAAKLNYKVLKDHKLDEIQDPKPDPHVTPIVQLPTIYNDKQRQTILALDANNMQEISPRVQETGVGAGYFRDLPVLIYWLIRQ